MNIFFSILCLLYEFVLNLKLNWFIVLFDYVFCYWLERKFWVWFNDICDNLS